MNQSGGIMRISIVLAVASLDAQIAAECDRLSCAFVATEGDPDPSDPDSPCGDCGRARKYHRIIAN